MKKKKDIQEVVLEPSETTSKITKPSIPTEFELNENSNKYNWNEEFVTKVSKKIFTWFEEDESSFFYSDFPRKDLKITFNQFCRKMAEFPNIWNDIKNELDLMTTTRLANAMLKNKISVPGAIQALKNMGEKWNDKSEVNINMKSISEQIQDAWNSTQDVQEKEDNVIIRRSNKPMRPEVKELTDEERAEIWASLGVVEDKKDENRALF